MKGMKTRRAVEATKGGPVGPRDDVPAEADVHITADSGREHLYCASIWPVHDENARVCGVGMALAEITERVAQLGRDRKMRALAIMAGKMAHHFNNILGGMVTRVDFAGQSSDVRVLRRCLNSTASGLQRATKLLDGLLAFAEADYRDADGETLAGIALKYIRDRHACSVQFSASCACRLLAPPTWSHGIPSPDKHGVEARSCLRRGTFASGRLLECFEKDGG